MDRRTFLEVSTAGIVALGLPSGTWLAGSFSTPQALAQPELLRILGNARVRDIGRHYRGAFPEEDDPQTLETAILAEPTPPDQQVRYDFAHGRTVLVKGWVLAVTEARQCALFSLLPS